MGHNSFLVSFKFSGRDVDLCIGFCSVNSCVTTDFDFCISISFFFNIDAPVNPVFVRNIVNIMNSYYSNNGLICTNLPKIPQPMAVSPPTFNPANKPIGPPIQDPITAPANGYIATLYLAAFSRNFSPSLTFTFASTISSSAEFTNSF